MQSILLEIIHLKYQRICVSLRCLKYTLETKVDQWVFTFTRYVLFDQINLKFYVMTGNQGNGQLTQ